MPARRVDQALVDELLRGRTPARALAHRDLLGADGQGERFGMDERIVENDVGAPQESAARSVSRSGAPGPAPDQVDLAVRVISIIPAATVWLLTSSIRMKEPVARLLR